MREVSYKKMFDEFSRIINNSETDIYPDTHYMVSDLSLIEDFIKFLKKKKLKLIEKEEIRTIPSCEEEAIALYGYNPKTKKYSSRKVKK